MVSDMAETEDQLPFDETLEKTGNGIYNILLAATCALSLLAIGADLFGFSLVVAAACDLELTVAQKGILTSTPFVGILLVSYIWGYLSDTKGRRFTLLLSLTFGFILSSICSLSLDWISLGVLKFLSVCFSCATNSVTYTLVGESCIRRVRNKYMVMMTCFILFSPAFAAVLTYPILKLDFEVPFWLGIVFRPWRLLNIILALPSGLGAVAMYFFHESPKFLANSGRKEEALEVMKSIYAINHSCTKEEFGVTSFTITETAKKEQSLLRAMYEQSAPLFRPPFLWRTLQLYFIVAVVFITNNSFLVWMPHILNLIRISMQTHSTTGNICTLISGDIVPIVINNTANVTASHANHVTPETCLGTIEDNVIITLMISQSVFAFLNFVISYLPNHRRKLMIGILCLSTVSGLLVNVTPEPISSVMLFMIFTSTCLCMGILASYFVDQYPTTYRGMVSCLSIMVGRSSSFVGINLVGNLIFQYCRITFNVWSLFVLSSVIAAWFLPSDKPLEPAKKATKL